MIALSLPMYGVTALEGRENGQKKPFQSSMYYFATARWAGRTLTLFFAIFCGAHKLN